MDAKYIGPGLPGYIDVVGNEVTTDYWGIGIKGTGQEMNTITSLWGMLADRWSKKLMVLRANLFGILGDAFNRQYGSSSMASLHTRTQFCRF